MAVYVELHHLLNIIAYIKASFRNLHAKTIPKLLKLSTKKGFKTIRRFVFVNKHLF